MTASVPTDFWSGWVIVITLVSLVGLCWLVFSTYFTPRATNVEGENESDTVWDHNLREGAHAAPLWWFWFMLALLCVSFIYLILYPGFGSFKGAFRWSQGGEITDRLAQFEERFGPLRAEIASTDLVVLKANSAYMQAAENLFDQHCAACHGRNAEGQANRFPNLRDSEWQWGSSAEAIEQTIRNGRTGIMVGWKNNLTRVQASLLAQHVIAMGKGLTSGRNHHYDQLCVACHGEDGKGLSALGAPDLTNDIYLYGDDSISIIHTILYGRRGEMPAFDHLDDMQIRLLVAWLLPDGNA